MIDEIDLASRARTEVKVPVHMGRRLKRFHPTVKERERKIIKLKDRTKLWGYFYCENPFFSLSFLHLHCVRLSQPFNRLFAQIKDLPSGIFD